MNTPATALHDPANAARLQRVVKRIQDLPSFPLVVQKLAEVSENPRSSSRDLAEVMETDQGLSAKVLKLVNSAFYSFPRPVASLQHAVTLIGYNSIRSLAMSVSVKSIFSGLEGSFDLARFWEHSLATAVGARLLAGKNCLPRDDLFAAGLLHDVGILLEARHFPAELAEVVAAVRENDEYLLAAEARVFGVTHCLLGAWLAERWCLPPTIRGPVLHHHDHELPVAESGDGESAAHELDPDQQRCVDVVVAASHIAGTLGFQPLPTSEGRPNLEIAALPAHLEPLFASTSPQAFQMEVREQFNKSKDFLSL